MQDPFGCVEDMHLSDAYTVMLGDNVSPYRENDVAAKRSHIALLGWPQRYPKMQMTAVLTFAKGPESTTAGHDPGKAFARPDIGNFGHRSGKQDHGNIARKFVPQLKKRGIFVKALGNQREERFSEEKEAQYVITNSDLAARTETSIGLR
ncbi:hypothetical protein CPAR01_15267 [Colletotrichum paranaense]|uniref:Uncharacterized protein n=1 Tax=Colletotrichum paranaense TaxID=1914294 RepID=A0ABQ9RZX7_9PEZI|nr:uncharacterized protein CPAR01_15267 [Colletotrichum paranaense]KAK1520216.1 hypothetical protein CPAR01_15267 [Colletotrichum paranaense]